MDAFSTALRALRGKPSEVLELIGGSEIAQHVTSWAALLAGGGALPACESGDDPTAYHLLATEILSVCLENVARIEGNIFYRMARWWSVPVDYVIYSRSGREKCIHATALAGLPLTRPPACPRSTILRQLRMSAAPSRSFSAASRPCPPSTGVCAL